MSECIDEKQFDKIVHDLHKWLEKRCCLDCAIMILGAVSGSLIWNRADNNKEATQACMEFCQHLAFHIDTLNDMHTEEKATLQ